MKKLIALFIIGLLSMAASLDAKDKRAELMMDMKLMQDAMEEIQSGGLYNNIDVMKSGVVNLQKAIKSLASEDVKEILPKDKVYAYKFAQKTASMLKLYSDDLIDSAKDGRMYDALNDYTQLLSQCMSCHIRIRQWEKEALGH